MRGEIPHTEYGYATMSFAKESAQNFRNQNLARRAEFLSTLAAAFSAAPGCAAAMARIYEDILSFDEHCYGMAMPYGPDFDFNWSSKAHHVWRACAQASQLSAQSMAALTARIAYGEGEVFITVFNPLGFERDSVVRLTEVPLDYCAYRLTDAETGEALSCEWRDISRHELPEPMAAERSVFFRMGEPERRLARELSFVAKGVPALGYRSYRLSRAGDLTPEPAPAQRSAMENAFYKIEFDPSGRIAGIYDKHLKKQLVDEESGHPFAGVIARDCHTQEQRPCEYHGLELLPGGAVEQRALIRLSANGAPQGTMCVVLQNGVKRIDFQLKLLYDGTPVNELFWALPLDIEEPQFEYEGALCRPTPWRDQFPGSNTNYYVIRNWASSFNAGIKAVISPVEMRVVDFGGLWPSYVSQAHHAVHPVDFGAPFARPEDVAKGHLYMLLAFNNVRTNFRMTQNGEVCYSFALTTIEGSASPTRFGWDAQHPLSACCVTKPPMGGNLPMMASLVDVDEDNIMLSVKAAEDGNGLILRLMETEGQAVTPTVRLPALAIGQVFQTNLVEEDAHPIAPLGAHSFKAEIKPYQILCFRVIPS